MCCVMFNSIDYLDCLWLKLFIIAVLKFAVKSAIYKPMQIRGFKICGS